MSGLPVGCRCFVAAGEPTFAVSSDYTATLVSPNLTRRANHQHTDIIAKIMKPAAGNGGGLFCWKDASPFSSSDRKTIDAAYLVSLALAFLIGIAALEATL